MGVDYDKTGMYVKSVPIRCTKCERANKKLLGVGGGGGLNKTLFVPDSSRREGK